MGRDGVQKLHVFGVERRAAGGSNSSSSPPSSLKLFGETPEAQEGVSAFNEKRVPEFAAYRGN